MSKPETALRSPGAALATAAVVATILGVSASAPGYGDDINLLRKADSKPYLFIVLDNSSSMNLSIGSNLPVIGGGDNPNSRIFAAKQALYNVFANIEDVYFGFASFNQDSVRVVAKHYLYYNPGPMPAAAAWPLTTFPAADANGLTRFEDRLNLNNDPSGTDGFADTVIADIQGDVLTFGPMFDVNGAPGIQPTEQEAGTCAAPLTLGAVGDINRLKVDAFALLNSPPIGTKPADYRTTTLWLSNGGTKYQLTLSRPANRADGTVNAQVGEDDLAVDFTLKTVTACGPPVSFGATTWTQQFRLRQDPRMKETIISDQSFPGETSANLWPAWSDVLASSSCGDRHPHSGKGWEGNYDSGGTPPAYVTLAPGYPVDVDKFCISAGNCISLKPQVQTTYSTFGRGADHGDVIPFNWNDTQREQFLARLTPSHLIDTPVEFGVAPHLKPHEFANGELLYEAKQNQRAPLMAAGNAPIGRTSLDFRCWYMGPNANKCGAYPTELQGWADIACLNDPDWGCRQPYLIVISDGEGDCDANAPTSEIANMNSKAGIKTWTVAVGPDGCRPPLHSMAQAGKGECVPVSDPEELYNTINQILGLILQETRTFASAAVPSVQAVADQSIFLTSFTPLNGESRWPGHINSFVKPLPVDPVTKKPDYTRVCTGPDSTGCFAWDAGFVLENEQTQRNVFYARQSLPGEWVTGKATLQPVPPAATEETRYDLLRGFDLVSEDTATDSLSPAQETAYTAQLNDIITTATGDIARPTCNNGPEEPLCDFTLGDIFHSDPIVFGQPSVANLRLPDPGKEANSGSAQCTAGGEGSSNFDRSYECFYNRHLFRRQVVYVGANDGYVHGFNAAEFRFDPDDRPGRYDHGTGHELFAYMPRTAMPKARIMAETQLHQYSVDGPIAAGDVFIDPAFSGSPNPDDRRWRTVALGGLREGGRGYYALDITQPDKLGEDNDPDTGLKRFIPNLTGSSDPDHLPTCLNGYASGACGPIMFGAPLWEFTDNTNNQWFTNPGLRPSVPYTMDEDGNGFPDLGFTWSKPDFSRIQICTGTDPDKCKITEDPTTSEDIETRFVAIFGGGMDTEHKSYDPRSAMPSGTAPNTYFPISGNWLYMVDVETGQVLYKRQLCSPYRTNASNPSNPCVPGGSAPADVAAIDTDLNGTVDRIYIGTTGGYMYRVDLQRVTTAADGTLNIEVPPLQDMSLRALDSNLNPTSVTVKRIPYKDSEGNAYWQPYVLLDANPSGTTGIPRPIFYRPAVILNQQAGVYALAFGTGDREDLWTVYPQTQRFYLFNDDYDPAVNTAPFTEANFTMVTPDGGPVAATTNFLIQPTLNHRGWWLELRTAERAITSAFSFIGVTFFSTYRPDNVGGQLCNAGAGGLCQHKGTSRQWLVNATNGNGLLGSQARYREITKFVTPPFTEFTTGNTGSVINTADQMSESDKAIMEQLKNLFPKNCRFTNARIDIKTVADDTSVEKLASIPICLAGHSWKEF